MGKNYKLKTLLFLAILLLSLPFVSNADSVGQQADFFIAQEYDAINRDKVTANLRVMGEKLYFYIDNNWWDTLSVVSRNEYKTSLNQLSQEFETAIYPVLTSLFGFEWKPGIDMDERITVLIHPMTDNAAGYVRTNDEYPAIQAPLSNEREMIYLNAHHIDNPLFKSYLAHEFQHLITFNQKERKYGLNEDIWFHEALSEYAPTAVGYDDIYEGSNLERRVNDFLKQPNDSITEWKGSAYDYGVLNLFTQYLVDHYGVKILVDALHSSEIGIASISSALRKNGFSVDFHQTFIDWTIAVLSNDCSSGGKYCYLNEHLIDLHISPSLNFLPFADRTTLTIQDSVKDWSGNWYKLMGGSGTLELQFDGVDEKDFQIPYFLCDLSNVCYLDFLSLNGSQQGTIKVDDFGNNYSSLVIIPSVNGELNDFGASEPDHPFILEAVTFKAPANEEQEEQEEEEDPVGEMTIEEMEAKIVDLLAQIVILKSELAKIIGEVVYEGIPSNFTFGTNFKTNAYLQDVIYLKAILDVEVPNHQSWSGTEYYGFKTQAAVKTFQEKYADEILDPWGLVEGTGYVGITTRAKMNELLGK